MSVDAFGPTQNISGLSRIVYYRMTGAIQSCCITPEYLNVLYAQIMS